MTGKMGEARRSRRALATAGPAGGRGNFHSELVQQWRTCFGVGAKLLILSVVLAQMSTGHAGQDQCVTSSFVRAPRGTELGSSLIKALRHDIADDRPTQVRIALNGSDHMQISWVTKSFGNPSIVDYGTTSGDYKASATGTATSYTYLLYKSGEIHYVDIGPLQYAMTYYYRLGQGNDVYSFKMPPPPGPEVPITFTVAGDLGQTSWTTATLEHMKRVAYDVMIYTGDLSYADYYQPLWDSFGELVSPLTSTRPWMVTQGNHEKEYLPLFVEAFRSYEARWSMPHSASGSPSKLFYSFEVAGCHILMLGSYADYGTASAQYKWLQADLAKVDRTKTPWLIVLVHAPWYNSNTAHQGDGAGMMEAMEPLLFAAKVDILFAGHVHAYERTTRVYKGVPNPLGIVHIVIGDGGNREGLASNYQWPQPEWSLFREANFGFGQLEIQNSTTAQWSWHRNADSVYVEADILSIHSLSDPNNPAYL